MDAKPHRSLRTMRTFHDENAHLSGPLPKTIHQRNKSSPALSSIAGGIGLKAAAKRTAFGDVSNITGLTRTAKEDTVNATKPKISNTLNERKSAAFLRPAHRPSSISNLKSILNTSNTVYASGDVAQRLSSSDIPLQQSSNIRKTITRRNTTIFKDVRLDTVQEIDHSDPQKHFVPEELQQKHDDIVSDVAVAQQDPQLYLPPPLVAPTVEPVKSPHPQQSQDVLSSIEHNYVDELPILEEIGASAMVEDASASLPSAAQHALVDQVEPLPELTPEDEPEFATAVKKIETQLSLPPLDEEVRNPAIVPAQQSHQEMMHFPNRPEPEEYWEEDEDGYEEEGYVTARSFRSKGDNTTGGATTVLVPRLNQQARREIDAATKLVEATRTPEEIEDEIFDTSMVAEYGDEIFEYMRQLEVKMSPNPHYMDNQHEIQWSMRSVLMDWLVQVHHRFNLLPETLFLCVNYIDRFLSSKVVSLGKLQLVGATAIFIAAKYEEINCPSVQEIVYMVDGGYTVDEILKAERFMLTMLQFELGWPGPMSFLRRISKADDYDLETRTLAKYFLEVTLMDERFIGSPPSFTAAASHCLARLMLRKGSWSAHHVYYSGYTFFQLRSIVQLLLDCCENPTKHHRAVYDKYCDKRYKRASVFVQTEMQRGFSLPEPPTVKPFTQSPSYAYYANAPYFGA